MGGVARWIECSRDRPAATERSDDAVDPHADLAAHQFLQRMKVENLPTITFIGFDGAERQVSADIGLSLMEAARDNNVPGIEAECGGAGACATCHVYIAKEWVSASGAAGRIERELLEMVDEPREESRLSCQIEITDELDGLVVRLPETQGFS